MLWHGPIASAAGRHHCRAEQKYFSFFFFFILESEGFTGIITIGNKLYRGVRGSLVTWQEQPQRAAGTLAGAVSHTAPGRSSLSTQPWNETQCSCSRKAPNSSQSSQKPPASPAPPRAVLTSAQHWPLAHPNRPARCMLTSREMCPWWGVHWQPKGKIRARAGHFGTSHCHWTQIPPSPSCRNGPSPEIPGCKPRGAGLIP